MSFAVVVAATPIVYDTLHVTDTTFIAMVAEWVHRGLIPGRDFSYFYGGVHEQFIAWAFSLTGITVKALDIALVLEYLTLVLLLLALAWKRMNTSTTAIFALVIAITIFARMPFEESSFLTELTSAHSFGYNRLGTAFLMLAAIPVFIPGETRSTRISGIILAAFCAAIAVLTKTTFFVVPVGLALALLILRRWLEFAIFLIAIAGVLLLFDPAGTRTLATFYYSTENVGGGAGNFVPLLRRAFRLVWSQQWYVFASCIFIVYLLLYSGGRRQAFAAIVVLAGFWASTVTMGSRGLSGHPALPMMAVLSILLWTQNRTALPDFSRRTEALVLLIASGFIVPHAVNIYGAVAMGIHNARFAAFDEGPLSGYLAQGRAFLDDRGREIGLLDHREDVVRETSSRLDRGESDASTDYVLLVEAVRMMDGIPGLSDAQLVSDTHLGIPFALGLPRAEGFPVWLRRGSPELKEDPLKSIDFVLLKASGSNFRDLIELHMSDFVLCRKNPLWELYSRNMSDGCEPE